jgi:hypothetical protein
MSAIDTVLSWPELYATRPAELDAALAQADAWHRTRNPAYDRLWRDRERPMLPAAVATALPTDTPGQGVHLGSSGTSGSARQVHYDPLSMRRIHQAMRRQFAHHGFDSAVPVRFLILAPDPEAGAHAGYATAFRAFTACAPVAEVKHGVTPDGTLDVEVCWQVLERWSTDPAPVFIFGLTVFFERLALTARPMRFKGPVRGLTGGGWKGLARTLDRPEVVRRLHAALGAEIRDLYGMTEHPVHYLGCAADRFHVPVFSRVSLVDAVDGEGLLRLESPLFASMPAHDLLTRDRGQMGQGCPCGNPAPWFVFRGRVTSARGTCAAQAVATCD